MLRGSLASLRCCLNFSISPGRSFVSAIPFAKSSKITLNEVLSVEEYKKIRPDVIKHQVNLRQKRRVYIGPDASIMFENYDLMWTQVHEMLLIEGGGEEQAKEEIEAYESLIPKGNDIVFTFMFEIDQKERRDKVLFGLGHVEDTISLLFGNHSVKATSAALDDIDRTTADGKTSSIHFLRFELSDEQCRDFKQANLSQDKAIVSVGHENYPHSVVLSSALSEQLKEDIN